MKKYFITLFILFLLCFSVDAATTTTFDFTDGNSGNVEQQLGFPTTYTAATGYANCKVLKQTSPVRDTRAIFNFDTSSIPAGSVITLVELKIEEALGQPATPPDGYGVYIGTYVNGSLDGNLGEWSGGNFMVQGVTLTVGSFFDLNIQGNDPARFVATGTGAETDISIWGQYQAPLNGKGRNYNTARNKTQLRVTYTPPFQVINIREN